MASNKPKVLVFIDWFLPGFKAGGPTRSLANLIDHLHNEIDFYIVTRNNDYLQEEPYHGVFPNRWIKKYHVNIYYLSPENVNYSNIKQLVNTTECDVVYVNGIYSLYFSILPVLFSRHKKQLIASRGMLAETAIAIKSTKKTFFLKFANWMGWYKNAVFHATNNNELKDIQRVFKNNKILIAPNLPKKVMLEHFQHKAKFKGELKLFSLARIAPEKNLLFALEILKECEQKISFDIYGSIYDEHYWEKCMALIAAMPENIVVTHKHEIEPDQVNAIISHYHFLFLPTLGENFGHAIFESFTAAVPVIISDKTPWRNLEQLNCGYDIPLNNKGKFIEVLEKLGLMNDDDYNEMSKSALKFAADFVNNKEIKEQNLNLFLNC